MVSILKIKFLQESVGHLCSLKYFSLRWGTVISHLSTQLEPTRFVRTLDLPLANRFCFTTMLKKPNKKHLNEHQRCEIISKLSKMNAPNKKALAWEYNVSEGAIRKVWDN
jgi:hypothetical protein